MVMRGLILDMRTGAVVESDQPAGDAAALAAQAAIDEAAQQQRAALAALNDLDLSSIRALREYIAAKADAPQALKDKEAAAVVERGKLK
jgi:hypothetical protein